MIVFPGSKVEQFLCLFVRGRGLRLGWVCLDVLRFLTKHSPGVGVGVCDSVWVQPTVGKVVADLIVVIGSCRMEMKGWPMWVVCVCVCDYGQ